MPHEKMQTARTNVRFLRLYSWVRKRVTLLAAGAALVGIAALYLAVTSPERDLNRFLDKLATIEVGKTRLDIWLETVEQMRSPHVIVRCDQRSCGIGWRGGNSILKALRLAPQTIVDASVGFDDGIASEIYIVMEVAEHNEIKDWHQDRIVVVRLSDENPSACHDHYKAELTRRYGAGEDNRATVAMDRCVSRGEFTSAVAINTGCLTRIGGCKTIPAMLPLVFGRH
jgi:hypothetical protein